MTDSVVRYEMRAAVAYVTLNRPEKLNALSPQVLTGLATAIELASEDPEVRVVVIRGAGGRGMGVHHTPATDARSFYFICRIATPIVSAGRVDWASEAGDA